MHLHLQKYKWFIESYKCINISITIHYYLKYSLSYNISLCIFTHSLCIIFISLYAVNQVWKSCKNNHFSSAYNNGTPPTMWCEGNSYTHIHMRSTRLPLCAYMRVYTVMHMLHLLLWALSCILFSPPVIRSLSHEFLFINAEFSTAFTLIVCISNQYFVGFFLTFPTVPT